MEANLSSVGATFGAEPRGVIVQRDRFVPVTKVMNNSALHHREVTLTLLHVGQQQVLWDMSLLVCRILAGTVMAGWGVGGVPLVL